MQDIRLALRALRGTPIVTTMAIVSLALGIGANSAIFSLVNSLVLRTLPVRDPRQLVAVSSGPAAAYGTFSQATYDRIRQRRLFAGDFVWAASLLTIDREPRGLLSQWVSGEYFSTLGVAAFAGRTLTAADDVAGGGPDGPVGMISYRLWQGRFSGAPDVIGRSLLIERTPITIVGIAPPDFFGIEVGQSADLFLPVSINAAIRPAIPYDAHTPWLRMMLRLRPDQTREAATAALRVAQPEIRAEAVPPRMPAAEFLTAPFVLAPAGHGSSWLRGEYRRPLLTLQALSALVLLVACVNLANLLLGRGAARRRELGVRRALGASRGRLIRLLLAESALLAAIGGALGLLFAIWASRALVSQISTGDPPIVLDLSLDARVLLFTAAMTIATAILFGLAPALRATDASPIDIVRGDGRGTPGRASNRTSSLLLVCQVAVSLLLVVAAGLLVRTAQQLARVSLGFDHERVLTAMVTATTVPAAERNRFYHHLVDVVSTVPGVASAGGGLDGPLTRFLAGLPVSVPGARPLPPADTISQLIDITPGWLGAYGTPLRAGRDIDRRDIAGAPPVMLVNEAFVRRFFPGERLVGRTLAMTVDVPGSGAIALGAKTIVGIVGDAVYDSMRGPVPPTIYAPLAQRDGPLFLSVFFLAIRPETTASPAQVTRGIAEALRAVDPDLRQTIRPAAEQVDARLARDRLVARLSAFGGALALLLATLGLYGVTAYAVWRRRTEIAIRMALGGTPASIVRLILSRLLGLVAAGVLIGAAGALWMTTYIAPLLYGLSPADPLTFAGAALIFALAGLLAGWLPARRAARIDPARVLRA